MHPVRRQHRLFWVVLCSGGILPVLNADFRSVGSN